MPANRIFKALSLLSILRLSSAFSTAPFAKQNENSLLTNILQKQPQQLKPATFNPSLNRKNVYYSTTKLNSLMDIVGVSPEPIHTAFSMATFGPQPFWLFIILLPKAEITKKLMGKLGVLNRILFSSK
jgi:hypothetical protein